MERKFNIDRMENLPPLGVSFLSTLKIKTGSWRYLRPFYRRKTASCDCACPAGEDIVSWIRFIGEERLEDAFQAIREENPFPAVCGRVCFHPCEVACNRGNFDQAIPIHLLERFVADFGIGRGSKPGKLPIRRIEEIGIIGAGPSGLSCAYQLARLGYATTVFEAAEEAGGVLRTGIPEYRLPKHVLDHEIDMIKTLGVKIETGVEIRKLEELKEFAAIYIATGAPHSLKIGITGEDLQGVVSAVDFLRSINLGKREVVEGTVAIIGGGNSAIDAARSALRMGARPLILYRRSRQEMPAIEDEIKEAEREGVEILYQVSPIKVLGKEGRVTGLECIRMHLADPDFSGRRRPVAIEDSNFVLNVGGVVNATGQVPDLAFLEGNIETKGQLVLTDSSTATSKKGVFAGGDVTLQPRTVVHAIGTGKIGAMAIDQFICGDDIKRIEALVRIGETGTFSMERYMKRDEGSDAGSLERVCFENLNLDYFERQNPVEIEITSSTKRITDFSEVDQGITGFVAKELAGRCFSCGLCDRCGNCLIFCPDMAISLGHDEGLEINYDYCKGCGICAVECPRSAICMEEERE
jgi:2-oxoacid:acceptor oxidoreductase delta subunit (pyruvate/2-ketoisovalerate family)